MTVAYQVRVYSTGGSLQAVMDRFRALQIEHRVNTPSTLTLSMYELDPAVQYFTLDAIVEVRRRVLDAGLDWYTEYVGFHRTPQRQITEGDTRIFTSYSRGLLDLIRRRSIRYPADSDGSAKGPGPADDIIKQYVRENAGTLAFTGFGRKSDGATSGLAVAPNLSQGPTHEGAGAWRNLLEAIREWGETHKVDFDVVWGGPSSANTFEFRTYYPQLGTDRRTGTANPFVFTPNMANMSDASFTLSRTDEITSALVLGPGESVFRDTTLRTSPRMTDSPWNTIEQDLDQSNEDREEALNQAGDDLLFQKRAATSIAFSTIQTPFASYGKHYFLGDIVTAQFSTVSATVKIRAVSITLNENVERVALELEEVP